MKHSDLKNIVKELVEAEIGKTETDPETGVKTTLTRIDPETGLPFTREGLRDFMTQEAWGHHASCTCKMGPSPENGDVVDSKFQVYGVKGLRIVDASVFPKIPGLFIAAPIYTISEKAADILSQKYN